MTKRYAIWDKRTPIITPSGAVFTPEEWIERYPVAALEHITVICGAGEINGSFFGTLGQLKQMYEAEGADFSQCRTEEEALEQIEAWEEKLRNEKGDPTAEERIAAALEFQNLMSL